MFGSSKERALTILNGIMGPFKKMFLAHLKNFKDGDKYYDKFEHLFSKMSQKFLKLSTYDPNEFNVINHGDCWINNLLFKFGPNKELVDVIFVDFQLPKYGHPSTDLLNFIMTSVHIDLKLKEFDFFIKYYHDHLIEHLLLLGYSERMPTLRNFIRSCINMASGQLQLLLWCCQLFYWIPTKKHLKVPSSRTCCTPIAVIRLILRKYYHG
ncbi:uncharacterized protein LOC133849726 [Drosophila sulfurigaster albostrigata]|uniref:uncharacterized protein LOC133849726 n=1 Tax=Drosophila sulfurigaster albostrigata TaxID=89887 RepID=UPI002D21B63E|nr:uncharacterized protein LOC133849726 [Drosophila sulfurigaster albostrigata]